MSECATNVEYQVQNFQNFLQTQKHEAVQTQDFQNESLRLKNVNNLERLFRILMRSLYKPVKKVSI